MISTKDKIAYIRRIELQDGTTQFKFIESKITSVRVGKHKTSVYSDRFRALDAEELEDNTQIMSNRSGLVIVNDPFITNDELSAHLREVVEHWNKYGAETALGNHTKPSVEAET